MSGSKNKKVTKYRKPFHINIGVIIFAAIFIYLVICVYMYATRVRISPYEVKAGSLAEDNTYTGLILRQETVVNAEQSGYVNYYAREKEKVANGTVVYSIDESGKAMEALAESAKEENILSGDNLKTIKSEIQNFSSSFDNSDFTSVYDFKYSLEGDIIELMNTAMLTDLGEIASQAGGMFNTYSAAEPGVIVYNVDQLEGVTADVVTPDMFDETAYKRTNLRTNEIVNLGDPAYKLITGEDWSVVIQMDEDQVRRMQDMQYVQVRFLDDNTKAWASFSMSSRDGNTYGKLDFRNSMIRYADKRYLHIELMLDQTKGLKIPASSLVDKDFYLIPLDYLTVGGTSSQEGFMLETYDENGQASMEMIYPTVYSVSETEAYVDTVEFHLGDYVIKPESQERYQIGKKATLKGVYNINKGYAIFRQVNILYQNEEYCIVEEGTKYGLSIYDHIALDGSAVKEDDIIYQ